MHLKAQITHFFDLLLVLMHSLFELLVISQEGLVLFCQFAYLLAEDEVFILKTGQELDRLCFSCLLVWALLLWDTLLHCVLNDNDQGLLTSLIQTHNSLDVVLLFFSLHEHCHYNLKKLQNFLLWIIFCNLNQLKVIDPQWFLTLGFHISFHFCN